MKRTPRAGGQGEDKGQEDKGEDKDMRRAVCVGGGGGYFTTKFTNFPGT